MMGDWQGNQYNLRRLFGKESILPNIEDGCDSQHLEKKDGGSAW